MWKGILHTALYVGVADLHMADPAILRDAADRKTLENCNCEHV